MIEGKEDYVLYVRVAECRSADFRSQRKPFSSWVTACLLHYEPASCSLQPG